jgi:NADPH-dependent F420 reductase
MAVRLSQIHDVIIGSREEEKAKSSSECCINILDWMGKKCRLCGVSNQAAVDAADVIILTIPYAHLAGTLSQLKGFENKLVISPVNPLVKKDYFAFVPPPEGSAAMLVQKMLPGAKVCSAFNAIAANRWRALDEELDYSVPVCGDDAGAKKTVMEIVNQVSRLKAYDAGPLEASCMVESLTPLLLNIARYNKLRDIGIQFR